MKIGRHFCRYFRELVQLLLDLGRMPRRILFELIQAYMEQRHALTHVVVQLSGNARALLLPCVD